MSISSMIVTAAFSGFLLTFLYAVLRWSVADSRSRGKSGWPLAVLMGGVPMAAFAARLALPSLLPRSLAIGLMLGVPLVVWLGWLVTRPSVRHSSSDPVLCGAGGASRMDGTPGTVAGPTAGSVGGFDTSRGGRCESIIGCSRSRGAARGHQLSFEQRMGTRQVCRFLRRSHSLCRARHRNTCRPAAWVFQRRRAHIVGVSMGGNIVATWLTTNRSNQRQPGQLEPSRDVAHASAVACRGDASSRPRSSSAKTSRRPSLKRGDGGPHAIGQETIRRRRVLRGGESRRHDWQPRSCCSGRSAPLKWRPTYSLTEIRA